MNSTKTPAPVSVTSSNGTFFRMGFFSSLGGILAMMIFVFIGLLFFIPGLIIVMKQHKKEKADRSTGMLVLGYILMGIGMILGLGMGLGAFASQLSEDM
jgi:hypothetical protein